MSALFGPAGNGDAFAAKYKSSVDAPGYLRELGVDLYEYQCGRGVNVGEATARKIGAEAKKHGIEISVHAPYFISLSTIDEVKLEKNKKYILDSCRLVRWLGGDRVVVHCGGLSGLSREEALENTIANLQPILQAVEEAGCGDVRLCMETMGRVNVLGDLEEVIRICKSDERLLPCVDFGHLNARSQGGMFDLEDFIRALDRLEQELGERGRVFHAHFSKIEYSKGGEVRHLTFEDQQFGPNFDHLAGLLAQRGLSPHIICESAGTQDLDALAMKNMYKEECKRYGNQN